MSHAARVRHHHAAYHPNAATDTVRGFLAAISQCEETAADLDRIVEQKNPALLVQAMQRYWDATVIRQQVEPGSFQAQCADAVRAMADWDELAESRIHVIDAAHQMIVRKGFVQREAERAQPVDAVAR